MPERPGAGRLDPETFAAFVDGRLPPEERARVEDEIAADPENYEWLVSTLRGVDEVPHIAGVAERRSWRAVIPAAGISGLPLARRPALVGGGLAVLAIAAAAVLVIQLQPEWWQRLRGPQIDPLFARLVEAVGEERYIEARLTGGFRYGPQSRVMRGSSDPGTQNLELLVAASALHRVAARDRSSASRHAWGVAQLLTGDVPGSVETLRQAHVDSPTPELAADLAAALIALGQRTRDTAFFRQALAAVSDAAAQPTPLAEALYNRALALEELSAPEASTAWAAVASADPGSAWSAAARRRLAEPDRQR